ncbi:hypothetical protein [Bradyrhizobium sp. RT4b]|uniref:hypothetical protein n=1 Tax=Bradyrhizobium sp. RT4b TaxID=3156379 RepID=UPI003396D1A0
MMKRPRVEAFNATSDRSSVNETKPVLFSATGNERFDSDADTEGFAMMTARPVARGIIASTQIEADRLQDEFNELIQPEYSLTRLRQMIGRDLSGFDLDGPPNARSPIRKSPLAISFRWRPADGRVDIEEINYPFLYTPKGNGAEFGAGMRCG